MGRGWFFFANSTTTATSCGSSDSCERSPECEKVLAQRRVQSFVGTTSFGPEKLSFRGGSRLLCAAGQDDHCNPAYDQSAADGRMHDLTPRHFDSNRNRTGIKSVPLASWNGNEQRQNTEYDKD
jgi:hypothetical protein